MDLKETVTVHLIFLKSNSSVFKKLSKPPQIANTMQHPTDYANCRTIDGRPKARYIVMKDPTNPSSKCPTNRLGPRRLMIVSIVKQWNSIEEMKEMKSGNRSRGM